MSTTRDTVLIAVDGSSSSEKALTWFLDNGYKSHHHLLILHAINPPSIYGMTTHHVYNDLIEDLQNKGFQFKSKVAALLKERGLKLSKYPEGQVNYITSVESNVGHWIVSTAEKQKVKLIVMGSHGLNIFRRTLIGSASKYVFDHAHCTAVAVSRDHIITTSSASGIGLQVC